MTLVNKCVEQQGILLTGPWQSSIETVGCQIRLYAVIALVAQTLEQMLPTF